MKPVKCAGIVIEISNSVANSSISLVFFSHLKFPIYVRPILSSSPAPCLCLPVDFNCCQQQLSTYIITFCQMKGNVPRMRCSDFLIAVQINSSVKDKLLVGKATLIQEMERTGASEYSNVRIFILH